MANVFDLALPDGSALPSGVTVTNEYGVEFIDNVGLARTQAGVDAGSTVRVLVEPAMNNTGIHEMTVYINSIGSASELVGIYFRYSGTYNTWILTLYPFASPARIDLERVGSGASITSTTIATPSQGDNLTFGVSLSGSVINVLLNGTVIHAVDDSNGQENNDGRYYTMSQGAPISELSYNRTLTNTAPTASLGANQNITTGIEFTADASGSNDPDGDTLTYSYVLTTPSGSSATLADDTTASPRFTPDIDGEYTLTLTVSDGTDDSAQATQVLTAYTAGQAITMNADFISVIGNAVTLQCALSGEVTTSSWSITQAPVGSTATISNPSANPASFTPDVVGLYEATMTATTASGTEIDSYFFRVGDSLENGVPTASISTNGEPEIGEKITLIAKGAY